MAKEFKAPVSQDFEILDGGQVFGTLRVRPSGLLWAPKGSHNWYRVRIEDFGTYAVKKGTPKKK
jgi:hypothetical protein